MSEARQVLGALGEEVAARWFVRRGWRVLARRFRSGHRDLDLVVERGGTVAFVEVKARRTLEFGDPVEAVGWRKQRELARSAQAWIDREGRSRAPTAREYRFDVLGVLAEGKHIRVRHVEDAFQLPVRPPVRR
jgi:putative endonuclease